MHDQKIISYHPLEDLMDLDTKFDTKDKLILDIQNNLRNIPIINFKPKEENKETNKLSAFIRKEGADNTAMNSLKEEFPNQLKGRGGDVILRPATGIAQYEVTAKNDTLVNIGLLGDTGLKNEWSLLGGVIYANNSKFVIGAKQDIASNVVKITPLEDKITLIMKK